VSSRDWYSGRTLQVATGLLDERTAFDPSFDLRAVVMVVAVFMSIACSSSSRRCERHCLSLAESFAGLRAVIVYVLVLVRLLESFALKHHGREGLFR
jgi:hypothetical protein